MIIDIFISWYICFAFHFLLIPVPAAFFLLQLIFLLEGIVPERRRIIVALSVSSSAFSSFV